MRQGCCTNVARIIDSLWVGDIMVYVKDANGEEFWMDDKLKEQLDYVHYNQGKDYDFVLLISGSGMVRTGKSTLASQIGSYLSARNDRTFDTQNIVFNGEELKQRAGDLPEKSIIWFDEGRSDFDSKRTMESKSKELMDFFSEMGYLNHVIIICLPDFFELNKGLAVNRSELLINVKRGSRLRTNAKGEQYLSFERGYAGFYGRKRKRLLYLFGKRDLNYHATKQDFPFKFINKWCISKEGYDTLKMQYVKRDKEEKPKKLLEKTKFQRNAAYAYLYDLVSSYPKVATGLKKYGLDIKTEAVRKKATEHIEKNPHLFTRCHTKYLNGAQIVNYPQNTNQNGVKENEK